MPEEIETPLIPSKNVPCLHPKWTNIRWAHPDHGETGRWPEALVQDCAECGYTRLIAQG